MFALCFLARFLIIRKAPEREEDVFVPRGLSLYYLEGY